MLLLRHLLPLCPIESHKPQTSRNPPVPPGFSHPKTFRNRAILPTPLKAKAATAKRLSHKMPQKRGSSLPPYPKDKLRSPQAKGLPGTSFHSLVSAAKKTVPQLRLLPPHPKEFFSAPMNPFSPIRSPPEESTARPADLLSKIRILQAFPVSYVHPPIGVDLILYVLQVRTADRKKHTVFQENHAVFHLHHMDKVDNTAPINKNKFLRRQFLINLL